MAASGEMLDDPAGNLKLCQYEYWPMSEWFFFRIAIKKTTEQQWNLRAPLAQRTALPGYAPKRDPHPFIRRFSFPPVGETYAGGLQRLRENLPRWFLTATGRQTARDLLHQREREMPPW